MQDAAHDAPITPQELIAGTAEPVDDGKSEYQEDAGGNGSAFEILHFAGCDIGQSRGSDVESGETADAAADEIREASNVPEAAQAEGIAKDGWSDAEGNDVR